MRTRRPSAASVRKVADSSTSGKIETWDPKCAQSSGEIASLEQNRDILASDA